MIKNVSNNNRRKSCFNCEAYSEARYIYFFAQVEDEGSYVGDNYLEKIIGRRIVDVMKDNIGDMDGNYYNHVAFSDNIIWLHRRRILDIMAV